MKLGEFKLLTDENIHVDVVAFLRNLGFDVLNFAKRGCMDPPMLTFLGVR